MSVNPVLPTLSTLADAFSALGGFDCHVHVFSGEFALASDARYRPATDAPLSTFLTLLGRQGLAGGVLIQPSFLGTDNQQILDAIAHHPDRLRGIAVIDPDCPGETLERLHQGGIVGIRLNLIGRPIPTLTDGPWPDLLARLAALGWQVEVQAEGGDWERILPPLLRAGVTVVIDHMGRPTHMACPGLAAILAHAAHPRLWVKFSAPYRFPTGLAARVAPWLFEWLGPDRVLWGSDWPWTQHPEILSYGETLRWLIDWVPDPGLRRQVLRDNPARLFGFTVPATA